MRLNWARTAPEFPRSNTHQMVGDPLDGNGTRIKNRTVDIDDGSPDHSELGAPDLFARTIDIRTPLSKIESVSTVSVGSSILVE